MPLNIGDSIKNDVGERFTISDLLGSVSFDELSDEEEEGHYVDVTDANGTEISGVAIKKETSDVFTFEFLTEDEEDES